MNLAATPGSLIDERYRIEELVGRGGMSEVYRATDETLHRTVAVKLYHRDAGTPDDMERAANEVKLLASLSHYALVTVFDARVAMTADNGYVYLVMELVEGEDLRARIDRGPISRNDVAAMACDLAEALHVVHSHDVVHRDIKPANVLLSASPLPDREFTVKLADFGIAHLIDSPGPTETGAVIGTAAYLSPEQAKGERPGPATDIYALGLMLLEALTGVRAFPGSMVESVSARLVRDPTIPDSVGHEWKALLTAMTARDPEERPVALDVAVAARSLSEPSSSSLFPATSPEEQATTPLNQLDLATAAMAQSDLMAADDAERWRLSDPDSPTKEIDITATSDSAAAGDSSSERSRASVREPSSSRRWPKVMAILLGVLVLAAVGFFVLSMLTSGDSSAPVLPALDDPLGTHLQELLESVTP